MNDTQSLIYQSAQIREIEQLAMKQLGLSFHVLMNRAGKAAFDFLLSRFPEAKKIAICCGSGNNGGDGYVLADLLDAHGFEVTIWQVGRRDHMKEEAKRALAICLKSNIPIYTLDQKSDLNYPDVLVDAICGMGCKEVLRDEVILAIEKIKRTKAPVLALDIPTGINADTGEIMGSAVKAKATITFIGLKLGLLTGSGMAYAGEIIVDDLQIPHTLLTEVKPVAEKIKLATFSRYLKPRLKNWHKGLSGHVLIIGGDMGYSGAPRMAAEAAFRVGAGLVTVATRREHAAYMNMTCPEIMCVGVSEAKDLEPLLKKAHVIVIGTGLGQSAWSKLVWDAIRKEDKPLVVDADGLNLLAQTPMTNDNWVLTPHPGEAGRLLGQKTTDIEEDRLSAIKAIQERYHGIAVLKGAGSLVLAPQALTGLCTWGNPGMASAGMGDILSGVIAGFIAQGASLADAAKLGVVIHAMAGDRAANEGERGMMATDLLPYLRRLCNKE